MQRPRSDQLAKAAASDSDAKIVFSRLPISTLISKIERNKTKLAKRNGKSVQRQE